MITKLPKCDTLGERGIIEFGLIAHGHHKFKQKQVVLRTITFMDIRRVCRNKHNIKLCIVMENIWVSCALREMGFSQNLFYQMIIPG